MRRLVLVASAGISTAALADPAPAPPPPAWSWADWVGDWTGKLEWSSCTATGERRATLALDAIDGAMAIDLAPAGSALQLMALVEDGSGWTGRRDDVRVHLERSKDRLDLAIDLDSGCEIRGSLARSTVGIPACDRLEAWTRVEAQCTKLSRPPLGNPTRVARQRAEWKKARGDALAKLAAQCTARGAKLEAQLVDAGCAPHGDPAIGVRGTECQALRSTGARIARCTAMPPDLRAALEREVVVLVAAAQGADKASIPVVEAECRRSREKLVAVAQQVGCAP